MDEHDKEYEDEESQNVECSDMVTEVISPLTENIIVVDSRTTIVNDGSDVVLATIAPLAETFEGDDSRTNEIKDDNENVSATESPIAESLEIEDPPTYEGKDGSDNVAEVITPLMEIEHVEVEDSRTYEVKYGSEIVVEVENVVVKHSEVKNGNEVVPEAISANVEGVISRTSERYDDIKMVHMILSQTDENVESQVLRATDGIEMVTDSISSNTGTSTGTSHVYSGSMLEVEMDETESTNDVNANSKASIGTENISALVPSVGIQSLLDEAVPMVQMIDDQNIIMEVVRCLPDDTEVSMLNNESHMQQTEDMNVETTNQILHTDAILQDPVTNDDEPSTSTGMDGPFRILQVSD
jgi:hypothetical protein